MTPEQNRQALDAVYHIARLNADRIISDPDGDYPKCKPDLGSATYCQRCGNMLGVIKKACPATPETQRWRIEHEHT